MTAAHKSAKAWYDAHAGNDIFVDTEERREFREDMVRRLTGHLEPYFKAEVERVAVPLIRALKEVKHDCEHCDWSCINCYKSVNMKDSDLYLSVVRALDSYRKETNK